MSSDPHFTYVRDFLACIAPGETQFVFQAIQDPQPRTAHTPLVGTLEQCYATLQRDNLQRFGIYWQPNPGPGRLYGDITAVRALFLDFDSGGLPALPLTPHCVVETSPGKFQAYWRVADCPLDQFDRLLDALVDRWSSDQNAKGRNRLFRVAGFTHAKGDPFVSRVTAWVPTAEPYSVQQIRDGLLPGWAEPVRAQRAVTQQDWESKTDAERAIAVDHIEDALSRIPADDHAVWIEVGHALAGLGDLGMDIWDRWSQKSDKYSGRESLEAAKVAGTRTGYASLFNKALQYDPTYLNPASHAAKLRDMDVGSIFGQGEVPVAAGPAQSAPSPAQAGPAPNTQLTFQAAAGGSIAATALNLVEALCSGENDKFLAFDEFLGQAMIKVGGAWRPIDDDDRMLLRVEFERRGFKPIQGKLMADAMDHAARKNRFDSAINWANSLVWDGVKRVSGALHRYYEVVDTPYTRACSEYMFTAMAGRCLSPGCQADMVPVFIGLQGARKTSAIRALAPAPDYFMTMDFTEKDDNLARKFRGTLVVELGELKGLAGRDQESTKEWVTRREETWRPPFKEFQVKYKRRAILVGSGNKKTILDDETGERRWLPMDAGRVDVEALERDCAQLWAEGIAMWREGGIRWAEAERLARDVHPEYKVRDDWAPAIQQWLADPPNQATDGFDVDLTIKCRGDYPFTTLRLLQGALNYEPGKVDRRASDRVSKILAPLNFKNMTVVIKGQKVWGWKKADDTLPHH